MKKTFKQFREHLNKECQGTIHKHNRYNQRSREYGDYLYFQDRDKFDVLFNEWLKKDIK